MLFTVLGSLLVENVFFLRAAVWSARAFSQTAKVELLRISQLPYPFYQPPTLLYTPPTSLLLLTLKKLF